jgi:hypothetical protein
VAVVCPDGVGAGDRLTVEAGGVEVEVVVPLGAAPGEEFLAPPAPARPPPSRDPADDDRAFTPSRSTRSHVHGGAPCGATTERRGVRPPASTDSSADTPN